MKENTIQNKREKKQGGKEGIAAIRQEMHKGGKNDRQEGRQKWGQDG